MPPGPRPIRSFRLVRRCRVRVRVGRVRVGGVRVSRVSGEVGLGEEISDDSEVQMQVNRM